MKILYLIGDGMGDRPIPEFNNRTILEAAETVHMDELARRGLSGLIQTVPQGMEPGSDIANMALLGFDPAVHHTGRGPIEAAAQGLELAEDDIVWRLNLVTVTAYSEQGTMLDYSAGHIDTETAAELIKVLDKELGSDEFQLIPGVQYRHLLVQKHGAGSAEAGFAIRPPHDILDQPIAPDVQTYDTSPGLKALMRGAAERLEELKSRFPSIKANSLWPWGQGKPLSLPTFQESFGLKGGVISAVDLVRGLGRAADMEVLEVEGVTGLLDTNYEGKVDAAAEFLNRGGEFVYLHVEAPDECGHSGIAADKAEAVRRFDTRIVAPLVERFPDSYIFIACDHYTPVSVRTHTTEPVPFVLAGPGISPDTPVDGYNEKAALSSGILIEPGHEIMRWVIDTVK